MMHHETENKEVQGNIPIINLFNSYHYYQLFSYKKVLLCFEIAEAMSTGRREAWTADNSHRHWTYNRRPNERRVLLMAQQPSTPQPYHMHHRNQPNVIYTTEVSIILDER
jgi:hypothetical protein